MGRRDGRIKSVYTSLDGPPDPRGEYERIACVGENSSFTLVKAEKASPYVAKSAGGGPGRTTLRTAFMNFRFIDTLYGEPPVPFATLLTDQDCHFTGADSETRDGKTLVTITFNYVGNRQWLRSGKIVADPARGWALQSFRSVLGPPLPGWRNSVGAEYSGVLGGVPLLKRMVLRRGETEKETSAFDTFEVVSIRLAPPDPEEFTIAHYGLPEPPAPDQPPQ